MTMSQAHKDAISRGVKKYHSECRKAMNKPPKKSKKKSNPPPNSPEVFKDNIPTPSKKKKLSEAEIKKREKEIKKLKEKQKKPQQFGKLAGKKVRRIKKK